MIDLNPRHLATVERILAEHAPGLEVRAFGSRATWTARDFSDLDLALVGESRLDTDVIWRLKEAFSESDLPIRVDVLDWHAISDKFREVIGPDCVVVQECSALRPNDGEWTATTFDQCAVLVRDTVQPSECGDMPYIGLEHIGESTLSLLGQGTASDVNSAKSRFRRGDILFGKLRPYFRKVIRAPFDGICSTDIWVVRPTDDVDVGYLFYLMASESFVEFATRGSEGTRMPRAQWEHVSQFELRLPAVGEQRRIARVLGGLDDKIELNRRMAETLEEMARVLFRSWFVDFEPVRAKQEGRWRRGQSLPGLPAYLYEAFPERLEPSELGPIPAGWRVAALGDVVETVRGRSYKSAELADSEVALVTLKSFARGGGYREDGLKPYTGPYKPEQVVKPGEVVVACTDVTQAGEVVGRPAIVQSAPEHTALVASLDTLIIRPRDESAMSRAFLYFLTGTPAFTAHALAHTTGTTVLHLAKDAVPDFRFAQPPADLIRAFDAAANPALACGQGVRTEAHRLVAIRDAVLPRLLSDRSGSAPSA